MLSATKQYVANTAQKQITDILAIKSKERITALFKV